MIRLWTRIRTYVDTVSEDHESTTGLKKDLSYVQSVNMLCSIMSTSILD